MVSLAGWIAVAILLAPTALRAQGESDESGTAGWIRVEDIPRRADALVRRMHAVEPEATFQAALDHIEESLTSLGPDIDAELRQATIALSRSTAYLELEDGLVHLRAITRPLEGWGKLLDTEGKRLADSLAMIRGERAVWTATQGRPEVGGDEGLMARHVQRSIELLDTTRASLEEWRGRTLGLNVAIRDRLVDVDVLLGRLHAASANARANLWIPASPPLWRVVSVPRLREEWRRLPDEWTHYGERVGADWRRQARRLAWHGLLLVTLIALFVWGSGRLRDRSGPGAVDLKAPYSLACLLALLPAPWIHSLAPRHLIQALSVLAILLALRVLRRDSRPVPRGLDIALVCVVLLDRFSAVTASLPGLTALGALSYLVTALATASYIAFVNRSHPSRLGALARVAILALAAAVLAELSGAHNLAVLVARALVGGTFTALCLAAVLPPLDGILRSVLASRRLRRSHLLTRRMKSLEGVLRQLLHAVAVLFWAYATLRAVALTGAAEVAIRSVWRAHISLGSLSLSLGAVLVFVATLFAAYVLANLIHAVLEEDVYPRTDIPRGISYAISSLVRYGVYSLGFLTAMMAAGFQLSQVSVLLGGFGVGLGLGLQDLVKNFAAGLTLLLERRVHVGDAMKIPGQDVFGRVRSIGTRATVVRAWDGSEVVVPNADLISGAVINWNLSDRLCRFEVPVGVGYESDPTHVLKLLEEIARRQEGTLSTPPPQALFLGFGESSLNFTLRAWTDEPYERVGSLTSGLAVAVHRGLSEAGISFPFPQRDVRIVGNVSRKEKA